MSEQTSGLRFDIYERVHLNEDIAGIHVLEEIELTPQIQVEVRDDQAVVKGCLLLSGRYGSSNESRSSASIEHAIPVEITLPLSRIPSIEAISVDIDNFDVDLVSSRSLNVTGVLSLYGIEMTSAAQDAWREEEEVVFVHQANEHRNEPAQERQPASADVGAFRAPERAIDEPSEDAAVKSVRATEQSACSPEDEDAAAAGAAASPVVNAAETFESPAPSARPTAADYDTVTVRIAGQPLDFRTADAAEWSAARPEVAEVAAPQQDAATDPPAIDLPRVSAGDGVVESAEPGEADGVVGSSSGTSRVAAGPAANDHAEAKTGDFGRSASGGADVQPTDADEPQELRVALAGRQEQAGVDSFAGVRELKSLYARTPAADSRTQTEQPEPEPVQEAPSSDGLEWKKLFLGKGNEAMSFRRLRLCIVQKDETLESIAEKYRLRPQELVLHNRLANPQVQEGQVIYIP